MSLRVLMLLLAPAAAVAQPVDRSPPAFRAGVELPSQVPVTPAVRAALKEMGISYLNYYVLATTGADERPPDEIRYRFGAREIVMRKAEGNGVDVQDSEGETP